MPSSLSQRLVARFAAVLFAVSGLVSLANHPLPKLAGMSNSGVALVSGASLLAAALVWVLPWDRWPRRALFAVVPLALALKALANHLGGVGPYGYGIHFVLIFSWIGLALPQWSSLAATPLLLAAYLTPMWLDGRPMNELTSAAVVVPICLLVGEITAWVSNRLRAAEREDARRVRRMGRLAESSVELARCADPSALADLVARLAAELLDAERTLVLWTDPERRLQGAGGYRWPTDPRVLRLRPRDHPLLAAALRTRDLAASGEDDAPDPSASLGLPNVVAIPVVGSGSPLGVVLVALRGRRRRLDAFERSLARTFATQVGLAVERLRATQALVDASLHDALTGVGNRRKASEALRELAAGDALVMVDLDHFKRVNDTLGHAAGDEVLRELADHLSHSVREHDLVVRWGGEEFLVLLRGVGEEAAAAVERLVATWRARGPVTTMSAGVAVHDGREAPARTLARADEALYAAKQAGRDRACAWAPGLATSQPREEPPASPSSDAAA